MAWISVDQKLIGGKLRGLYKTIGCSQSEAIGILVYLWLWGVDNALMDGEIVNADKTDIANALMPVITPGLDAGNIVESLIQCHWIDEVDGSLYFHDWSEWRAYYNKYINDKKNNAERQAKYKEKKRQEVPKDNNIGNVKDNVIKDVTDNVIKDVTDNVTGNVKSVSEQNVKNAPEKKAPKYDKDFETFWTVYPRKADKGMCYKKYQTRIKDGYTPEELLLAATKYAEQCKQQRTEQQYIKHGRTFLGDALPFVDFLPKMNEPEHKEQHNEPGVNPFRRL